MSGLRRRLVSRAAMTLLGAISVRVWAAATVMTCLCAAVLQQMNAVQPLPYMVNHLLQHGVQPTMHYGLLLGGILILPLKNFCTPPMDVYICPQISLRLRGFVCTPTCKRYCLFTTCPIFYSVSIVPPSLPWTTFLKRNMPCLVQESCIAYTHIQITFLLSCHVPTSPAL